MKVESVGWLIWLLATSPMWGALLWHVWLACIQPHLIPAAEIDAHADALIARHGARAEEAAFIEEDRAWRRSETAEQGRWRRVRRELWRRHEAGEWDGPAHPSSALPER